MTLREALAVFPILLVDRSRGGFELLGTGFFVNARLGLTAKHVFDRLWNEDVWTDDLEFWVVQYAAGGGVLRRVGEVCAHDTADIALVRFSSDPDIPKPVGYLLSPSRPEPGAILNTIALPSPRYLPGEQDVIELSARKFRGVLVEWLPGGRDRVVLPGPCIQTTIDLHGGASGGPVFAPDGGVFAVNSTSLTLPGGEPPVSWVTPVSAAFGLDLEFVDNASNVFRKTLFQMIQEGLVLALPGFSK